MLWALGDGIVSPPLCTTRSMFRGPKTVALFIVAFLERATAAMERSAHRLTARVAILSLHSCEFREKFRSVCGARFAETGTSGRETLVSFDDKQNHQVDAECGNIFSETVARFSYARSSNAKIENSSKRRIYFWDGGETVAPSWCLRVKDTLAALEIIV